MESKVKFHPAMEVPSAEMNALQGYAQKAFDDTIYSLLLQSVYYSGLIVTKNSATEVNVTSGRIWANGKSYRLDVDTDINLTSYFPAGSNKKIISIVATGQEVDTEASPRKFLVDPNTRTSRSRTVATRTERTIVLSVVQGVESFAPVPPVVDVNLAHLATLTLSSTGIVGEPEQQTGQQAPSLQNAMGLIQILQAQLAAQYGMISTLRTDIAGLGRQIAGLAPQRDIDRLEQAITMVREKVEIDDLASFYGYDRFDTDDESDTGHASYDAEAGAGAIAIKQTAGSTGLVALLNGSDSRVMTSSANGITLPAYTEVTRYELDSRETEISIASYPAVALNRIKLRHGFKFKWWKKRHKALWRAIKRMDGSVTIVDPVSGSKVDVDITKKNWRSYLQDDWGKWIWISDYAPYWEVDQVSNTITGATGAQTWLNAQAGWLTGVSLRFSALGASGDVRVVICECNDDGTPELQRALDEVVIPYSSLAVGWVKAALPPVHLARGVRYAFVVQTTGAHKLHASNSNGLSNGTFFYSTDSDYWDGSLQKDLSHRLHFASFPTQRVVVELGAASLSGGIASMDFTFSGVRPEAVDFDIQAQVGGVWQNLDVSNDSVFATVPNLVPLRAVWQNTQDDAVGINLLRSRYTAYRPKTTAVHISTARTLPAATTTPTVVVRQRLVGYDSGQHTHVIKLLHGVSYGTTKTALATSTKTLANGDVEFEATFDFTGAEISTYKIRTEMTITSVAEEYVVAERWDQSL